MSWVLSLGLLAVLSDLPTAPGIHQLTLDVPKAGRIFYGVSVPPGYDRARPTPLVVALHSGGERMRYYGAAFTRALVEPALRELHPIIVAPDCPTNAWTDGAADQAVMAVVAEAMRSYNIDPRRVVVVGFSMGGRGTWFEAARHGDLFTAAIPMAASVGDLTGAELARQPTYIIHSRNDEIVPFAPAERNARALADAGRTVHFDALEGLTHFEMFRYVEALRRGGRWVAEQWKH